VQADRLQALPNHPTTHRPTNPPTDYEDEIEDEDDSITQRPNDPKRKAGLPKKPRLSFPLVAEVSGSPAKPV
jgi:hypothetical protein